MDFFLDFLSIWQEGAFFNRSGESHGDVMIRFSSQNSRHSRNRRQSSAAVCCIQMTKREPRVDNRCAKIGAVAALHFFTLAIFDRRGSETCPNISAQVPPFCFNRIILLNTFSQKMTRHAHIQSSYSCLAT